MSTKRNIQQRGSSFLVDVTKLGKRQRVTCNSLEEALSTRAKLELATLAMPADQWTLKHAFDTCYNQEWRKTRNEGECKRLGEAVVNYFGADTLLDTITTEQVDGWIDRLEQIGNAGATINRKRAVLSKIMNFAHVRGKMRQKPYSKRQEEGKGRKRYLTQEEEVTVLRLLAEKGLDCHVDAVGVLVDTGLRPSELWRLAARDCNFDQNVLTIELTKNDEPRSIPMVSRVREILFRRASVTKTGPLFPFSNRWLRTEWNKVKAEMGLAKDTEFIPYALRHTCGSRLGQRGVNPFIIQEWLGHKDLKMTKRYTHYSAANLTEAAKVLERC